MDIQQIKNRLTDNHNGFVQYINTLTESEFQTGRNSKWTPGQQLEHILLAVKPVRQALGIPSFLLTLIWGKANRNSRTYDALVARYQEKLQNGGRATARFIPKVVSFNRRDKLASQLTQEVVSLNKKVDKFSEEDLDRCILPHPLLGKLTIREMLYFTIYHVEHHKNLTERDLRH